METRRTGNLAAPRQSEATARFDRAASAWEADDFGAILAQAARYGVPLLYLALAIALRLPYLMEVPGFTDEAIDVRVALDVLQGHWPLVDAEPYIGAAFNYLVAAGFAVLGQNGAVPRLLVSLLGAGTVVLLYFLARRLAGTLTALLAATFMTTSGIHIVLGHVAWSNCTTPFFTTAALLALVEAQARRGGPLLVAAGGLFGLALQTHISVIFLAPALLVQFLVGQVRVGEERIKRPDDSGLTGYRPWRTPWPYLAATAAILMYGNVIAFNVLNPGAWQAAASAKEYAFVADPTPGSYLSGLQELVLALPRMAAGVLTDGSTQLGQLAQPAVLPYLALLLLGFGYAIRDRLWLPGLGVVVTALLMPYLNKNYDFPLGVRYLGYLLPLLYLLMALPLAHLLNALWHRTRPAALAAAAVCVLLVALPAANLRGYAEQYLRTGGTSPTILALQTEVRLRYQAGLISEVLLDPQLDWVYTAPGGRALRAFDLLFTVEQVPHRTVWMVPEMVAPEAEGTEKPVVLIVSAASRERLGNRLGLVRLDVPDRPYLIRDGYWAYLLPRRTR